MDLDDAVETMSGRDGRRAAEAEQALFAAGPPGVAAVARGLIDPRPHIRKACARWGDHHGTDGFVPHLLAALDDPVAGVRREAVHALACQRCKPVPLTVDLTARLREIAVGDPSTRVRYQATWAMCAHGTDDATRTLLRRMRAEDHEPRIRRLAHELLRRHDPAYRAEVDARARLTYRARTEPDPQSPRAETA